MQADGYSLDDKRTRIETNDIPDIVEEWKVRNKNANDDRKAKHFFVPVEEITENNYDLSINRYKEIDYIPPKYDKPEVILEKLRTIEDDIYLGLDELRKMGY
jgi:type I restriction enzyme M protein